MPATNNDNGQKEKSWAVQVGDRISEWTSRLFAHPYVQIGIILFCVAWFALGLKTDLLTAALSILAITLTQMVLNTQYDREAEAHRRDVAMHAKLDELIAAKKGARNDFVGMEEKEEEEIVQLKDEVKDAIEDIAEADTPGQHHRAAQAVKQATRELKHEARNTSVTRKPATKKRATAKP
jgi:low affinity Fe/Cu permease